MPEESGIEINNPSKQPELTPEQLAAKEERIFNASTKLEGREMKPEPTNNKSEILPLMKDARDKAVIEGNPDKSGAMTRNIQNIQEELKGKP